MTVVLRAVPQGNSYDILVVLYTFWVQGRAIGKGINFHDLGIRNGINFCNFRNWFRVGYAFSESWYKVGYIFEKLI